MGVHIVASGVSSANEVIDGSSAGVGEHGFAAHGAIALAARAATACLARAGVAGDDVDLLIYVGVYRDDNIVEPAIAALVQREIGMSLDFAKKPRAGFSFDLLNSGCGILNAVQVASAYLLAGQVSRALLVSADAHPAARDAADFPYAAVGGALLLAHDADPLTPRFGRLHVRDDVDAAVGAEGFLSFAQSGIQGRDSVTIRRDADYEERALALLAASIVACAAREGLRLEDTLIVTSCLSPGFGARVAAAVGIDALRVLTATGLQKDPLSSALTIAFDEATRRGRLGGREPLIFAAVGGGLTCNCIVLHR